MFGVIACALPDAPSAHASRPKGAVARAEKTDLETVRKDLEEALQQASIELGIPLARAEDLAGGDPAENARITRAILGGESGARRDIVNELQHPPAFVGEAEIR